MHGNEGGLAFSADDLNASIGHVDPLTLANMLQEHAGSLRLVVLSECQSGDRQRPDSHVVGIAQALHRFLSMSPRHSFGYFPDVYGREMTRRARRQILGSPIPKLGGRPRDELFGPRKIAMRGAPFEHWGLQIAHV